MSDATASVVELRESRLRVLGFLLPLLVVVGAGVAACAQGGAAIAIVAGVVLAAAATAAFVRLLPRVVRPRVGFRADAAGVEDRTTITGIGRIPWSEVASIALRTYSGNAIVAIRLVRGGALTSRLAWPHRLLAGLCRAVGLADVTRWWLVPLASPDACRAALDALWAGGRGAAPAR